MIMSKDSESFTTVSLMIETFLQILVNSDVNVKLEATNVKSSLVVGEDVKVTSIDLSSAPVYVTHTGKLPVTSDTV